MNDLVIDIEAESISREAYIFAPIYRLRMTKKQLEKLVDDLEDFREEYYASKTESRCKT